ncbi:GNAT family N-acetyltransferase [Rhodococcus artemisiae]|uniref:GNAT family N-acetyltransferase n=1 Tax=Rhodococcus artemisiae TaxID=714159 RepID=A0ABU7LA25_9NOCA|nr:GNAT family N-acetyltransferase [Rhodococcus artemisiae]MEE2058413.1 GNAT family N-acetyltransferase [Rhodococcus artemisiae]
MSAIKHGPLAAIDPVTLYKILMLRTEVFVHEQRIVDEPELDGVDLEPFTELYWIEENDAVVATLRLIDDGNPAHIGRVATARSARGRGLAADLIEAALSANSTAVEISAQAHLESWYERFGFTRTGANYIEAGIDHLPMRLANPRLSR